MYISYHTHDNGIVYSVKFSFDIYCICTLRAALRFVYILNISIDIVYICIRVYVVYIYVHIETDRAIQRVIQEEFR